MGTPVTYHNPVNGEYTTILESAADNGGACTFFEVSLMPGGGNPLHYHTKFSEEFTAVKGLLGLQKGTTTVYLNPGQNMLVEPRHNHRFFNDNNEPIVFRVRLMPGQPHFENFLKAMFGLVNDGLTMTKNQVPKNIYYTAVMFVWGDTRLSNTFFKLISPLAKLFYKRAVALGVEKYLLKKYCS